MRFLLPHFFQGKGGDFQFWAREAELASQLMGRRCDKQGQGCRIAFSLARVCLLLASHNTFYYTLPYCASQILHFFFLNKSKVCGNTTLSDAG